MKYSAFFLILVFSSISQAQNYPRVNGSEYHFLEDGVTYEFLEGKTEATTFIGLDMDLDHQIQKFTVTCSHQIGKQIEEQYDAIDMNAYRTCLDRTNDVDSCEDIRKKIHKLNHNLGNRLVIYREQCFQPVKHKRGFWTCDDSLLTDAMRNSEHQYDRYLYYSCLVIKGNESEGLPNLYLLADQPGGWENNSIDAAYFIANYHMTNGQLDGQVRIRDSWHTDNYTEAAQTPQEKQRVEKAVEYFNKTSAVFLLLTDREGIDNYFFEMLWSAYLTTKIYFRSSIAYRQHEPDIVKWNFAPDMLDTNDQRDTLEQVIRYGNDCANLPRKSSNHPELYQAVTTSCRGMVDAAQKLIPVFDNWIETLIKPNCKHMLEMLTTDTDAENYNDPDCPEFDELHTEIHNITDEYGSLREKAFEDYRNSRK